MLNTVCLVARWALPDLLAWSSSFVQLSGRITDGLGGLWAYRFACFVCLFVCFFVFLFLVRLCFVLFLFITHVPPNVILLPLENSFLLFVLFLFLSLLSTCLSCLFVCFFDGLLFVITVMCI